MAIDRPVLLAIVCLDREHDLRLLTKVVSRRPYWISSQGLSHLLAINTSELPSLRLRVVLHRAHLILGVYR